MVIYYNHYLLTIQGVENIRKYLVLILMLFLIFTGCTMQEENYKRNYTVLFLGNSTPFISTLMKNGIKVDTNKETINYKNYDIVMVGKESVSSLDVKATKEAVLGGVNFFFLGIENDQFIQNNFFNQKSFSTLLEGYSTVQLYNYGDKIQSVAEVFKKSSDYTMIYNTIIKDYENKHQINK